ncbi:endospore germination permease [Paenibacillus sp. MMS20-IR301]|uniref:GerAB/ArcD/ProY family transporter n=1 Tax=Paenibacillus sp. MMS20-IR301 TaxID=2895946 RepID=UPI0028EA4A3A|nr:endospore germination permease [Paenibacillus sp. MMS20-IR301]WNS40945.1 endospore germination permease [Paenibacillus sp. MMS20-IR301]
MNNPRQITTLRAAAVISSTIIGVGILSFPRFMAAAGGSSAPFIAFCGVVFSFLCYWLLVSLCRRFPKDSLFVFSKALIGRHPATVFTAVIMIMFIMLTGLTVRQFGDVATTVLYKKTPIEATIFLMLLTCLLSSRRNIVKFSYIHFFYLPLIISSILVTILISLKSVDLLNLQPVLMTPTPEFWKGVREASYLFQSSFVIVLLIPFMEKPGQAVRAGALAIVISGAIYVLIVIASVGMFGSEETKLLIYPTLEMARSTAFGEGFLERLDALFMIIWVISVYTTVYTTYYISAYLLQVLFGFRDQHMAASLLLPLMFTLSLLPSNVFESYQWALHLGNAGMFLLLGYPLLLWSAYLIRRFRKEAAS